MRRLVHMNGRVYDPSIARFLSPDVQVPFPEHTQSYNRYSYVRNNPLSWVDPSGYGGKQAQKNKSEENENTPLSCPKGTEQVGDQCMPVVISRPDGCEGQSFCTSYTGDAVQDYGRSLTNAVGNFIADEVQGYVQEVRSFFQENHIGLTIGVNATLGGHPLVLFPGPFGGGGFSITLTSDLQFIFTFSGNVQGGLGAYGGVSGQLGGYYSNSIAPVASIDSPSIHAEANFGAGLSVGVAGDIGESSVTGVRSLSVGAGFGIQASGGVQTNTSFATPPLINWGAID